MRAESDMAVPPIDLSALEHYDALIQADIEATGRVAACAMPSKTRFCGLKAYSKSNKGLYCFSN